jgi:hypothetical protein
VDVDADAGAGQVSAVTQHRLGQQQVERPGDLEGPLVARPS